MGNEKRKSRAAEEMQVSLEARESARRKVERQALTDLNQGMDATGHEAVHHGINWGPSYRARGKKKARQAAKNDNR